MAPLDLCLQTWTIRHLLKAETQKTLKQIRDLGFEHLELAGIGRKTPAEFYRLCADYGFKIVGIHQPSLTSGPLDNLLDDTRFRCELFHSTFVTVMLDPEQRKSAEAYLQYADLCSRAGEKLKQEGITLCYQCYDYDLIPIPGFDRTKSGLHILVQETACKHLAFEIDTYFTRKAGLPLEAVFDICRARCRLVHINDFDKQGQQAPLGEGAIPWRRELPMIRTTSSPQWIILEHRTDDPLSWIKRSRSYFDKYLQ